MRHFACILPFVCHVIKLQILEPLPFCLLRVEQSGAAKILLGALQEVGTLT